MLSDTCLAHSQCSVKKRKLSRSVRDESLDLAGFLVIHSDVMQLILFYTVLLNRTEMCPCAARRRERLPSFGKNNIGSCGVKQTALQSHGCFVLPQNHETNKGQTKGGIREVQAYCEVFILMPVKSISISVLYCAIMIVSRKLATDMSAAALIA